MAQPTKDGHATSRHGEKYEVETMMLCIARRLATVGNGATKKAGNEAEIVKFKG